MPEFGDVLIKNITIIDGTGRSPQMGMDVLIGADTIAAIGQTGTLHSGSNIEVLDGKNLFLLPGFIEMHAHAMVPTCERMGDAVRFSGFDWSLSVQAARALLQFGITSARSPSTPSELGVALRDSIEAGRVAGPQFFVSGELINGRTTSPEAVRKEIRTQAAIGVDYIKLYSQLQPDAVQAGIDEAHRLGLPVIGHLGRTSWIQGMEAGIDFLTHAVPWTNEMLDPALHETYLHARRTRGGVRYRIDWLELLDPQSEYVGRVIQALIKHDIALDPTLVVYDSKFSYDRAGSRPVSPRYRENPNLHLVPGLISVWETCRILTADWTEQDFVRMEAAWPNMLVLVKRFHNEGVLLTTGSDTPNHWVIPGESLHQEMELLVEAGIEPADVLVMATRNGAQALGMLEDRGTIAVGKRADLVALEANPLASISHTRRIKWVMKGGKKH